MTEQKTIVTEVMTADVFQERTRRLETKQL